MLFAYFLLLNFDLYIISNYHAKIQVSSLKIQTWIIFRTLSAHFTFLNYVFLEKVAREHLLLINNYHNKFHVSKLFNITKNAL